MEVKRIQDINELINIEYIRYKAFNINMDVDIESNININNILDNKTICFGAYIDDILVGGIYLSCAREALIVDYVFVDPIYQNTGLQIGRNLIRYSLDNKKEIEDIFSKNIYFSYIAPMTPKCKSLYNRLGYHGENAMGEMVKVLK